MKLCERRIRWSTLAAALLGVATLGHAYDEDHVQAHLQPFVGGYVGLYQNNLDDLNKIAANKDDFLKLVPNAGLSLGVAYDRFHAGFSVGYQLPNSSTVTPDTAFFPIGYSRVRKDQVTGNPADSSAYVIRVSQVQALPYFKKYSYDLVPMEAFAEVTMFKNSSYVNFLMGGSVGVTYSTINLPMSVYVVNSGDTTKFYRGTNITEHETLFNSSVYLGARINIAERLNLQGSIGWRFQFTDEIYVSDMDSYLLNSDAEAHYHVGKDYGWIDNVYEGAVARQRLDLSGAFVRADLRWTFASQSEKDADRATMRRQEIRDAQIASAYRLR